MRTIGRAALGIILAVAALFGLVLAWAFVSYPTEYVMRLLRWGGADVYDYQKFPERRLAASTTPFKFESDQAEEIVRAAFAQDPAIEDLEAFLERNGTQGFIVIQNDIILYERYFNGASRDSIVTSFSVAKSYVSALIGIAIDEGIIGGVEDPITDHLPELAQRDPAFAGITLRDLLRMSSGIEYRENSFFSGDDAKTYYYPDLRRLALEETTVIDAPGAYFLYNNYHPLLLGMVLERATNMSVSEYLESRIWERIGTEFDGSWSLDSEQSGFEKMESGINGRVIDFAKFGRLYLHDGSWNGTQVVPAGWVRESTRPYTSDLEPGDGYYSYFWWGRARTDSIYDFVALGNHGQFIYVSPEKNLIIVRNGESYGEFGGAQRWLDMFYEFASNFEATAGE